MRGGGRHGERAVGVLVLPTLLIAAVFAGVVALAEVAPRTEPTEAFTIANLPTPVLGGEPVRCVRGTLEDRAAEVRARVPAGGRVTSELVLACPEGFDGVEVTYVGEVVGHILERGEDGAWVQVNDDGYALRTGPLPSHAVFQGTNTSLAVWLPTELVGRVTGLGGPNRRGDVVSLRGTIVRADPADGGGLTLRARDLEILAPSAALETPLHVPQALAAGFVTLCALAAGLALRRARADRR